MSLVRNHGGLPLAGGGLLLAHAFSFLLQKASSPLRMETNLDILLEGLPARRLGGPARPVVSSLATDSRRVVPGSLFFALPGTRTDGRLFVEEAIGRGATVVVGSGLGIRSDAVALVEADAADLRGIVATVARRFFGHPERSLGLVGVTGTNGKTTVAFLTRHLLGAEAPVGLLGTVEYHLGARTLPAYRTTPDAVDLHAMFAQMRDAGCRHAVMEVSSHGIDQRRVDGLPFRVAAFTNLSQDHLDYHGSMEAYFEVKSRLFTGALGTAPEAAVLNLDDPLGRVLAERLPAGVRRVGYGEAADAELRATDVVLSAQGSRFDVTWQGRTVRAATVLPGRYNVQNALAALGNVLSLGVGLDEAVARLAGFAGVPGRMERIDVGQPFSVFVDYAHTDDALRNALGMLRTVTPGRLHCVFGCGGNRDRAKRPRMVRAVQETADIAWATADNPRREELEAIFADMRAGVVDPSSIAWVPDRRRAIGRALEACRPGDTLLIAGKGHETYQEFADSVVPFDDRQVARELLRLRQGVASVHPPA